MEIIGDDLTPTDVPKMLSEETCLVVVEPEEEIVTSDVIAQTVEVVDLPIQTDPVDEPLDDVNECVSVSQPLDSAEAHIAESPSKVVLDSVDVASTATELPALPIPVQSEQSDTISPVAEDQDFEVDKTLHDVVALEQEVADRQSNQSVISTVSVFYAAPSIVP